ncbi:hypothetical protein HMF8227_00194 [Saliniradius amylolyticus]|uniref:Uncharacterized protein n=1 Tax=Saliniradius amylolyticus TaxID=2183582 RepID=A0A2S2DZJ1_9ALTE|nr:hypothetical protein [Saliniradius amylolyticus]AWL10702.1 hypothetical protein HMF8227_00194 [Saliniradius amylolyticus]
MMGQWTKVGVALVITGLVVPEIIDAVETAYRLDIKRDFGVLPWLIMTIVGAIILLRSAVVHFRARKSKKAEADSGEGKT